MDETARLLVVQALTEGLGGAVEWVSDKIIRQVEGDARNRGLRAHAIRQLVIQHVRYGGQVEQRREQRPEYSHRDYWYRAIIPDVDGMPRGLFVELELSDPDPECPCVVLVNAHPQST